MDLKHIKAKKWPLRDLLSLGTYYEMFKCFFRRNSFFCRRGRPKTEGTGAKPLIFPPPWGLYSFCCPAPQH